MAAPTSGCGGLLQLSVIAYRSLQIEQQPLATEESTQRRTLDDGEHLGTQAHEPQLYARLPLALLPFREHLERRVFEVEHTAEIEHDDLRLRLDDQWADFFGNAFSVEKEHPAAHAQQEQAGERLVLGMLGRAGPEHVRARFASQH